MTQGVDSGWIEPGLTRTSTESAESNRNRVLRRRQSTVS